ncbi:Protein of unknown function [Thalassobacillus cyri]|uniref:Phage gp6-like head-tail connector protein n=1 Tax=Thalassobacillus cyri TaxID=571932 RepID=A0A1H4C0B7_9BACI|nr:DUF3199 family protein [Thalassobacillus cyri]SEA53789.1 Protein of unknown function [Thalassobacillus cyri]
MFATAAEVKERTSFDEVSSLSDTEIENYLLRAERWIFRATGRDYSYEENTRTLEDLKVASIHLVELLWYQNLEETKEQAFSQVQSEKIGSYSYNLMKEASPGGNTGISELDNILDSLTPHSYGVNFFQVSGPSR